jgi:hypothetical protein
MRTMAAGAGTSYSRGVAIPCNVCSKPVQAQGEIARKRTTPPVSSKPSRASEPPPPPSPQPRFRE